MKYLDSSAISLERREFEECMRRKVIGQDEAILAISDLYNLFTVGLNAPGRPLGNILLCGGTGTGKTRLVEAMSEALFGTAQAIVKVNCGEFQHSHEVAKIIGSPPGYLGHRETHPLITNEKLARFHTERVKVSFLLFDELEKASDGLWQLMLGMMDKAQLTLGDNSTVDLSKTLIFMTSNLGGREITEITERGGIGFQSVGVDSAKVTDEKITKTAELAAKKKFTPEFMNRIDKTIVFHPLSQESLYSILNIELNRIQQRIIETDGGRFIFRTTKAAREFLLKEGTDVKYGARHLKRAIDRHVTVKLANLLSTRQVDAGDVIGIDRDGEELVFYKEATLTA